MSRVLPILFNTDMVRATLRQINPKTVTRRVVKGFIPEDAIWGYTMFTPKGCISCRGTFTDGYGEKFFKLRYQPGDILYVRETWSEWTGGYLYKAWQEPFVQPGESAVMRWHPSIHMPKEAARIWLKVIDVKVERLRDITNEQILKEGISKETVISYIRQCPDVSEEWGHTAHLIPFSELWDSTIKKSDIGRYDWQSNPWVWVIEFEQCEKPDNEE